MGTSQDIDLVEDSTSMDRRHRRQWHRRRHSCDPGQGRTLLTIGQDFFSIQEYVLSQYNASLHRNSTTPLTSFDPAATMVYTDIQTLRGVDAPTDYGSGIEYAQGLAEAFPTSGLQIGLWLNGTSGCRDVVRHGLWKDNIHKLFANIAKWNLPKVFLRVGYEFDNPYFGYSEDPNMYVEAFRYIVQACEEQLGVKACHELVAFCWHSWAAPRSVQQLDKFYPGNDYVDWVGISIFQQLYPWATTSSDSSGDFAGGSLDCVLQVLDFAQAHDKPVLIAESTPFGGMFWNGTSFSKGSNPIPPINITAPLAKDIWDLWFKPTLKLIEDYDIRMWSYINCDWNSQPMWHNIGFGDTRLISSTRVMKEWWEQVLQNPRFVRAPLTCHNDKDDGRWEDVAGTTSAKLVAPTMLLTGDGVIETWLPKLIILAFVVGLASVLGRRYQTSAWSHLRRVRLGSSGRVNDRTTMTTTNNKRAYGSVAQA